MGLVILLTAGALVARAMVKHNGTSAAPESTGFAALPATPEQAPALDAAANPPDTDAIKEIAALSELNSVAEDMAGVFVFVPGKTEATTKAPTALIRGAIRTMEPQLNGGKIGIFALKAGSPDCEQIASQTAVPGVLAMVKGRGMAPEAGEITETKLVQAYVTASSAGGGCGPSSSGCGPASAGCK